MKLKQKSRSLKKLEARIAGAESIDENLDLKNGISIKVMKEKQVQLDGAYHEFNVAAASVNRLGLVIRGLEGEADDLSERFLMGVGAKWGSDSEQFKQAGGKPKSERKKRGQRKKEEAARKRAHGRDTKEQAAASAGGDSSPPESAAASGAGLA